MGRLNGLKGKVGANWSSARMRKVENEILRKLFPFHSIRKGEKKDKGKLEGKERKEIRKDAFIMRGWKEGKGKRYERMRS